VQVASEDYVGHDDGPAAEGDVGCSCDGAAAGYFVAGVLGFLVNMTQLIFVRFERCMEKDKKEIQKK
jgi:hypothetical protein